jgi:hypothetical protein
LSGAIAKLASINLWKLVLSPTGSINLGFILREDLLLCSSYLPLGVPNWAVIYTPSHRRHQRPILGDRSLYFGTLSGWGVAPGAISIDSTAIFIAVADFHDEEGVVLPQG